MRLVHIVPLLTLGTHELSPYWHLKHVNCPPIDTWNTWTVPLLTLGTREHHKRIFELLSTLHYTIQRILCDTILNQYNILSSLYHLYMTFHKAHSHPNGITSTLTSCEIPSTCAAPSESLLIRWTSFWVTYVWNVICNTGSCPHLLIYNIRINHSITIRYVGRQFIRKFSFIVLLQIGYSLWST